MIFLNVINELCKFFLWLINYKFYIGNLEFTILGSILFAGVITLFIYVVVSLFGTNHD